MRVICRIFARFQAGAKRFLHLLRIYAHSAAWVKYTFIFFIIAQHHFTGCHKRSSVSQRMPVYRRRPAVVFLGKKACRLIIFCERFWHFQLPFVFFIKLALNQLIFKQVFAAEQHLYAGIQRDRVLHPVNHRILFGNARDQLVHNVSHRLAVHV